MGGGSKYSSKQSFAENLKDGSKTERLNKKFVSCEKLEQHSDEEEDLRIEKREEKPEKVEKKSEEKTEEVVCSVCFENKPDSVYMPCGHGGVCYSCAIDIWKNSDDCYLCRKVRGNLYGLF